MPRPGASSDSSSKGSSSDSKSGSVSAADVGACGEGGSELRCSYRGENLGKIGSHPGVRCLLFSREFPKLVCDTETPFPSPFRGVARLHSRVQVLKDREARSARKEPLRRECVDGLTARREERLGACDCACNDEASMAGSRWARVGTA